MKKMRFILFVFLITVMCIFSVCAVSVVEMKIEENNSAYTLSVVGSSDGSVNTAEVLFSFDNKVVIPVDAQDGADVYCTSDTIRGTSAPFLSEMSLAPVQWIVQDDITTVKLTAYSVSAVDASQGVTVAKFHFRIAEGEKVSKSTFSIAEKEIVEHAYGLNDVVSAAAIRFGNDVYSSLGAIEDTIIFKGIDLSDISNEDRILTGDVTQDGYVNTADAIALLKKMASNSVVFTKKQLKAADCVTDGHLNVMDVIKLMQYLASDEVKLN